MKERLKLATPAHCKGCMHLWSGGTQPWCCSFGGGKAKDKQSHCINVNGKALRSPVKK